MTLAFYSRVFFAVESLHSLRGRRESRLDTGSCKLSVWRHRKSARSARAPGMGGASRPRADGSEGSLLAIWRTEPPHSPVPSPALGMGGAQKKDKDRSGNMEIGWIKPTERIGDTGNGVCAQPARLKIRIHRF